MTLITATLIIEKECTVATKADMELTLLASSATAVVEYVSAHGSLITTAAKGLKKAHIGILGFITKLKRREIFMIFYEKCVKLSITWCQSMMRLFQMGLEGNPSPFWG